MNKKELPKAARDTLCPNNLETVLSRLQKVKKTGNGKYLALCPAHNDKTPSLAIKAADDRVLLHCFGGCETADVLSALNLSFADIMPNECNGNFPKEKKPFYASEVLQTVRDEAQFTHFCAIHMSKGFQLCDTDLKRLAMAATNLKHAYEVTKHGM